MVGEETAYRHQFRNKGPVTADTEETFGRKDSLKSLKGNRSPSNLLALGKLAMADATRDP